MSKILSVVVPSYNVEEDLGSTINSLLAVDEAQLNLIEIIIVNDGSKDRTIDVANKIKEQWPTVITVIDKENGGHGSGINCGIEQATAKYFKVLDAGDHVDSKAFSQLIDSLTTEEADIFVSPYIRAFNKSQTTEKQDYPQLTHLKHYTMDELFVAMQDIPHMHSIVYRTAILKDNSVRLTHHSFYVDMQYNIYPIPYLETAMYLDYPVYRYELEVDNQSVSYHSYLKNRLMHENVIKSLIDYVSEQQSSLSEVQIEAINHKIAELISVQYNIYLSYPDVNKGYNDFMKFQNFLRVNHTYSIDHPFRTKAKILKRAPFMFMPLSAWFKKTKLK